MKDRLKKKLTTNFIATNTVLSVFMAGKLINNKKFLSDFVNFLQIWIKDNKKELEFKKEEKADKSN